MTIILYIGIFVLLFIYATYFMYKDNHLSGDEVITYSMANSPKGWMLSEGRVVEYLKDKIFDRNIIEMFNNIISAGKDLIVNRGASDFLAYPRPTESGWYDSDTIKHWFKISENYRFHFGNVYMNALGDDANSFLYYECVHAVSSIFPAISYTKWCGFSVNVICLGIAFFLLYKIAKCYLKVFSPIIPCVLWGVSVGCLSQITNIRAYMLATVWQLCLFWLHLKLYNIYKTEKSIHTILLIQIGIVYILGFVSHYTTGLWATSLGIYTIIYLIAQKEKRLGIFLRYTTAGLLAIFIGIAIDPLSMAGLIIKLKHTGGGENFVINSFGEFQAGIFGSSIFLSLFLIIVFLNIAILVKNKGLAHKYWMKESCLFFIVLYSIVVVLLTKQTYFKGVYPIWILVICTQMEMFYELIRCKTVRGIGIPGQFEKNYIFSIFTILFIIYILTGFFSMHQKISTEGIEYNQISDIMEKEKIDDILFIRSRASMYEYFPLLTNFKDSLIITLPNESLNKFLEDSKLADEEAMWVLIENNDIFIKELMDWANKAYSINLKEIYKGQSVALYSWCKTGYE